MTEPRLYLVTPPLAAPGEGAAVFAAAAASGAVACALLRLATNEPGQSKAVARAVCDILQPAGIAVVVEDDTRLAGRAEADGVHVAGAGEALAAALKSMRPKRIVGVGALASRDEAMQAGEAEPDYLMFGEPAADGFVRPLDWRVERAGWWSEIFNVPCVAYAAQADEVAALAQAGADFVALGPWLFAEADPAAILKRAAADLAAAPARA
ncbi:MAG: thiamine phosphate synthase [Rhizobiales bacterium]|nr:thiamine phosphate synthase [Hyphomicrobiales bacterium]